MSKDRRKRRESSRSEGAGTKAHSRLNLPVLVLSLVIGLALGYLAFVAFLQAPTLSITRPAVAAVLALFAGAINYLACTRWLAVRLGEMRHPKLSIIVGLLLPALFLPSLFRQPAYPQSPLLQSWTQVKIQLQSSGVNSTSGELPRNAVRLDLGARNIVNRHGFSADGQWQPVGDALALAPGRSGSLEWEGGVSDAATLTILPPAIDGTLTVAWDGETTISELTPASVEPLSLQRAFAVPFGYSLSIYLGIYLISSWVLIIALLIVRPGLRQIDALLGSPIVFWICVILLGAISILIVKVQFENLPLPGFLEGEQVFRHVQMMTGQADDPWQYRVLSEAIVEVGVRLSRALGATQPYVPAFTAVRVLQNAAIIFLALALYQRVAASRTLALLGVLILAAGMGTVFYDSDLSFNTYSDLVFYLLAALLLIRRHYFATAWVAFFSALNRETSGLIPFMLLAAIMVQGDSLRTNGAAFLFSACAFAAVFVGLRLLMPGRPPFIPHGQAAGFPLLIYNLTRQTTWSNLFSTLGFIPFVALAAYDAWPRLWQVFMLILVPAWFVTHFVLGVAAETRLFLVPQALIFVPGVLFLMNKLLADAQPARRTAAI